MRILYAGNTANMGYLVTFHMRKAGIDMDLLIEKNPSPPNDPLIRDPNLKNEYPNWINFYDKSKFNWKINLLQKMKQYNLIQASSGLITYSYLSKKPLIAQPIGSELRITAFSNSLKGILMRRALRKAKAIIVSSPEMISLIRKLKLDNYVFFALFLDFSFFKPKTIDKGQYEKKLVIFSPTNLNWKHKGNDKLIKGFAKFCKKNPNALLLLADHGIDSDKTHQLIKSLNIDEQVNFINGPLSKSELEYYYNISDVIADQFIIDDIGAIGRETLCCQKPLITNFNELGYSKLYPNLPPIAKASTSEEIFRQLISLQDEDRRKKIGKECLEWITKNNSIELFQKNSKILYESVLAGEKIIEIREKISGQEIFQE